MASTGASPAAEVTLAWDPSPDTNVVGYNVYWGTASRNYTQVKNAGNSTSTTISNLVEGTTYYFAATAYDSWGLESDYSAEAVYTVPAAVRNYPPTLNDLPAISVLEGAGARTVTLGGISSGSSTEQQVLTVTAVSSNPGLIPNPTVSYSSPATSGSLTFTPMPLLFGSATITVIVNDGGDTNATVSKSFVVTVLPVNNPPTLSVINNVNVLEDAAAFTVNLSGISSGAANESQILAVTATSSNPALIPAPTVAYTSPAATGSLTLRPVATKFGTSTITVNVNDGGASNNIVTRTFVVNVTAVNDAPTINAPANITMDRGTSKAITLTGISSGATNEAQTLTVTAASSNPALIPAPTISYASPGTTATLSLTSLAGTGTSTITVTVSDGIAQKTVTFTATVLPVNTLPTLNAITDITVLEDAAAFTVSLTGISSGATDEPQTLALTATSSNPALIPTPTVAYTSPSTTGTLTLKPVATKFGTSTITVKVNDGGASNNIVTRTFVVNVTAVNDAPTINAPANITMNRGTPSITITLTGITSGATNEPQTLTLTASSSNPALIPAPTTAYVSPATTGALTLTPSAGTGSSIITVTVSDGIAQKAVTFTATVLPVNTLPTLNAISGITVLEDAAAFTVNLTGISSGAPDESQTLAVTATSSNPALIPNPTVAYASPSTTGTLTLKPIATKFGTSTITVKVNDGGASNNIVTRTFVVNVTAVNDAPTINAPANITINQGTLTQALTLTGITSGATNEAQTLTVTAASSNPGLIPTPSISYTSPATTALLTLAPSAGTGSSTITITVSDGSAQKSISFVATVNSPPAISDIQDITIALGSNMPPVGFVIGDAQTPAGNLMLSASSSNLELVEPTGITFGGSGTNRTVSVAPVAGITGLVTITVTVSDGSATASDTFQLAVQPRPSAPGSLRIDIEGLGKVSPTVSAPLVTGRTYTFTAIPAAGQEFAGWSGTFESSLTSIKFKAKGATELKAKFVPSPFLPVKGRYTGLFYENDEVRQHSSGFFYITSTDRGKYSGYMLMGSRRYSFSGKFGLDGGATNRIAIGGTNRLTLRLQLPASGSDLLLGEVIASTWTSQITSYKGSFSTLKNPAPWAGRYTVVLSGNSTNPSLPCGYGYATLSVGKTGTSTLSGQLPDGTAFTKSLYLADRGLFPIYIPVHSSKGSIVSWTGMEERERDDLNGDAQWIKPAISTKAGFSMSINAVGSKFLAGKRSVPGFSGRAGQVVIEFSTRAITNDVYFSSTSNSSRATSPTRLVISVSPATGTFNGTVVDPVSKKTLTYRGVFMQKQAAGYGYVRGYSSGRVTVF